MNIKKLSILGGVLLLLVVGIFISENLSNKKGTSAKKDFFPGYTAEECSRLVIKDKDGKTVSLFKKEGTWFVTENAKVEESGGSPLLDNSKKSADSQSYKVDSASITSALEKLSDIKMGDIISSNKDKQNLFELDSAKGTFVQVFGKSGKDLGTIVIGKTGTVWSENYVRMVESNDVYSVPGTIRYSFFSDLKKWRDKTVMKLDPLDIQKVEVVSKEKGNVTIESAKDSLGAQIWNITAPEKTTADNKAVTDLIASIATLKTYDWETSDTLSESDMGLDSPDLTLKFTTTSGAEKIINFGKKWESSSKRWLTSTDYSNIFIVWQSNFMKSDKGIEDLKIKVEEVKK